MPPCNTSHKHTQHINTVLAMVAVLVTVLATLLATAVLGQTMDPCPPCDQVSY